MRMKNFLNLYLFGLSSHKLLSSIQDTYINYSIGFQGQQKGENVSNCKPNGGMAKTVQKSLFGFTNFQKLQTTCFQTFDLLQGA